MKRLQFALVIGLCTALLLIPLIGSAGVPVPVNDYADGHPWDDGDTGDDSSPIDTTRDTVFSMEMKSEGKGPNAAKMPLTAYGYFILVLKSTLSLF